MSQFKKKLIKYLPEFIKDNLIRSSISINYDITDEYRFRLASSESDFRQVGKLIYKRYRDAGIQKDDHQSERLTIYQALPNSATLMMLKDEKLIGTVTLIGDSSIGLPSKKIANIENLLLSKRCAEVSCLAIDREYKGKFLMYLFKYVYEVAYYLLRVEYLIISTTEKSSIGENLYRPLLLFNESHESKVMSYEDANGEKCKTQVLDVANAKHFYKEVYRGKAKEKNIYHFFIKHKCKSFDLDYKVDIPNPITYEAAFNVILKNSFVNNQITNDMTQKIISFYNGSPYEEEIMKHFSKVTGQYSKRRHQRFPCFDNALLVKDSKYMKVQLLNLSESGMQLYYKSEKQKDQKDIVGDTYQLYWLKQSDEFISKKIKVIWQKENRIGIEFL